MKFDISFDEIKFNRDVLRVSDFVKMCAEELFNTKARLGRNLSHGQDAEGGAMRPYSKDYAAWKKEKTGKDVVNLLLTGEMLRSQQVKTTNDGAEFYFQQSHKGEKTNPEIATYLHKRGFVRWFEYGKLDIKRIEKRVADAVKKAAEKLIDIKKQR